MTGMPECIHHVPFDTECPRCIAESRGGGLPRLEDMWLASGVCPALTSSRGGGENRRPAAGAGSSPAVAKSRESYPNKPAGMASGPREAKRGRPRIEDRGKPKPWETAGMSRASWYRRKAEKAK